MSIMRNGKKLKIIVISDNAYYWLGIQKMVEEIAWSDVKIRYQYITERHFLSGLHQPQGIYLKVDTPFVFADDFAYRLLKQEIKNPSINLFGTHASLQEVSGSLQNVKNNVTCEINIDCIQSRLTHRENMMYMFLINGYGDDSISRLMNISKKSVSDYRGRIIRKLGYRNKNRFITCEQHYIQESGGNNV
ncbi:hypothetical protein FEM41_04105 [Jejubacter calystegiae]|uniref:HTH luxR-type domain-containing protein n=1 Tax=Jejubacter calystegiae TaxID=2579935 RepID=A0A4P8YEJ6_9ENTR|nr:LuxR C-terminal-related transcriptional regulator [Jejubacter calystegiae]QCT18890.1 hypothetical protein FEM41_04105 [Jejubacter calystegiae]